MALKNMTLIQAVTVGAGGAANIEFTSIPQTYTDLLIKTSLRGSAVDTWIQVRVTFNGSTTSYTNRNLLGNGSAASSSSNDFTNSIGRGMLSEGTSYTTNTFASSDFYIPNYTSSYYKSTSSEATTENNATASTMVLDAGLWSNTAAINQITLTSDSGNFAQYSTAYLYGVSNTITGGAKAYGGIVYEDTNYWYHAFLSSGTFTPTQSITADVLVIAGGGGGGGPETVEDTGGGGGGGAGALRAHTAQSLSATSYAVTVGAGGSAGTGTAAGGNGGNSQFGSISVSTGGGYGGGGGNTGYNGANGGSGGGGRSQSSAKGGSSAGTGTTGGNDGGGGYSGGQRGGGGGGGAGATGVAGAFSSSGAGGDGVNTYSSWATATITGVSGYYAGGGGGGEGGASGNGPGAGGAGGGGTGGNNLSIGLPAVINTGSGGGGGGQKSNLGGNGASGLVIVRYAK